jgi:hypothetical protein
MFTLRDPIASIRQGPAKAKQLRNPASLPESAVTVSSITTAFRQRPWDDSSVIRTQCSVCQETRAPVIRPILGVGTFWACDFCWVNVSSSGARLAVLAAGDAAVSKGPLLGLVWLTAARSAGRKGRKLFWAS